MRDSAPGSDSKSSALCRRHPRSLGPQDTSAGCSLTEWQEAKLRRAGLSKELGGGRLKAFKSRSQHGAPFPVAAEHAGRGWEGKTAFLNSPACLTLPKEQMPGTFFSWDPNEPLVGPPQPLPWFTTWVRPFPGQA